MLFFFDLYHTESTDERTDEHLWHNNMAKTRLLFPDPSSPKSTDKRTDELLRHNDTPQCRPVFVGSLLYRSLRTNEQTNTLSTSTRHKHVSSLRALARRNRRISERTNACGTTNTPHTRPAFFRILTKHNPRAHERTNPCDTTWHNFGSLFFDHHDMMSTDKSDGRTIAPEPGSEPSGLFFRPRRTARRALKSSSSGTSGSRRSRSSSIRSLAACTRATRPSWPSRPPFER